MKSGGRVESLDALRGVAMMFVILFHSSIYNYANIHKIDFSDPPLLIVLMSFMALWGGIFIIYSATANTLRFAERGGPGRTPGLVRQLLHGTAMYVVLHYLLNIFLGRWNIDFVNNRPDMTLVASVLRRTGMGLPPFTELFEGSSVATVAFNLLLVLPLVGALLGDGRSNRRRRAYWVLALLGMVVMLGSFVRVWAYPIFDRAKEAGNLPLSFAGSFLLANPYPLLPYFAYGCFGALIGLMIHDRRRDLLARVILPLGLAFLAYGLAGMARFDKSISTPDFFWYSKTNFELGAFMLMLAAVYLLLEGRRVTAWLTVPKWFSRVSLTVYMAETSLSELLRLAVTPLVPGWNETIGGCLLFGLLNVVVWTGVLWTWRRNGFRYGLEHLWVWWMERAGKNSTKLELAE